MEGTPIGQHPRVCRFMKGVMIKKPPSRSLLPTWDLKTVLNFLQGVLFEPVTAASIQAITMKMIFLVAITTARRVSELAALGRHSPYMREERTGIRIRTLPGFLSKTATPGHLGQDILLPTFKANPLLCVKRMFKVYVKATSVILAKKDEDRLFINCEGPNKGKPMSKGTIAAWIRKTIKAAYAAIGRTPPKVKAHSTRGMATSWAIYNRATIDAIMRAADWRHKSTFINHYSLNLWKEKDTSFGKAVLSQ
jgi:integrase